MGHTFSTHHDVRIQQFVELLNVLIQNSKKMLSMLFRLGKFILVIRFLLFKSLYPTLNKLGKFTYKIPAAKPKKNKSLVSPNPNL
jgi:hypothetical protein